MFRTKRQTSAIICTHNVITYTFHYTHMLEKPAGKKKWPRRKCSRSFLLLLFGNSLHYNRLLCIQYQIYGRACAIISAWAVSTRTHRKGTSSNLRAYLHVIDNDELNREYITSLILCIYRCALISLSYSYISLPPLLHRPSISWFLFLRSNVLHIQQGFIPCSSLMEVQAVANHRLSDEKLDRKRFAHRIRRMLHVAHTWEVKKKAFSFLKRAASFRLWLVVYQYNSKWDFLAKYPARGHHRLTWKSRTAWLKKTRKKKDKKTWKCRGVVNAALHNFENSQKRLKIRRGGSSTPRAITKITASVPHGGKVATV